jgi:DNA-directed RNA polymerase subunit RPC12/RpoP
MIRYICQLCGYQGVDQDETDLDRVQCAMCGEPAGEQLSEPGS